MDKKTRGRGRNILFILLLLLGVFIIVTLAYMTGLMDKLRYTSLIVRWTTESEIGVLGYNIYRSDTAEGEFVLINEHLIPPSPDPLMRQEHSYQDDGRERGRSYYYILETIDYNGHIKERTVPIPIP